MTPKCPQCGSIIYSRRNVLCGVCGDRLPPELLFTPEQRAVVEKELEELKLRERAERQKQFDNSIGSDPYSGGF